MGRSRIPLVALVGAVGCTSQEASTPSEAPQAATSPGRKLKDALTPSESRSKGGGLRALTPEERESLLPRPIPGPEGLEAQPAPVAAVEVQDGGTAPTDYAEQRRQQLARERLEGVGFREYGKGHSMKRREIIHIIRRSPDGGVPDPWAEPAPKSTRD